MVYILSLQETEILFEYNFSRQELHQKINSYKMLLNFQQESNFCDRRRYERSKYACNEEKSLQVLQILWTYLKHR